MGDLESVTLEKKYIYLHIIIIGTLHTGSDTLEKKNFLGWFNDSVACEQTYGH